MWKVVRLPIIPKNLHRNSIRAFCTTNGSTTKTDATEQDPFANGFQSGFRSAFLGESSIAAKSRSIPHSYSRKKKPEKSSARKRSHVRKSKPFILSQDSENLWENGEDLQLSCGNCTMPIVPNVKALELMLWNNSLHLIGTFPHAVKNLSICDVPVFPNAELDTRVQRSKWKLAKAVCPSCKMFVGSLGLISSKVLPMVLFKSKNVVLSDKKTGKTRPTDAWNELQGVSFNSEDEYKEVIGMNSGPLVPEMQTTVTELYYKLQAAKTYEELISVYANADGTGKSPYNLCYATLQMMKLKFDSGDSSLDLEDIQTILDDIELLTTISPNSSGRQPYSTAGSIASPQFGAYAFVPIDILAPFAVAVAQIHPDKEIAKKTLHAITFEIFNIGSRYGFGVPSHINQLILAAHGTLKVPFVLGKSSDEYPEIARKPYVGLISRNTYSAKKLPKPEYILTWNKEDGIKTLKTEQKLPPVAQQLEPGLTITEQPDEELSSVEPEDPCSISPYLRKSADSKLSSIKLNRPWSRIYTVNSQESLEYAAKRLDLLAKSANALLVDNVPSYSTAVGIDAEWRPVFRKGALSTCALVQVATRTEVFLFDVKEMGQDIAPVLDNLLSNTSILKVGHGLSNDLQMFYDAVDKENKFKTGNFPTYSMIEVSHLAKALEDTVEHETKENRSLTAMMEQVTGRPLSKKNQMSNWDYRPLRKSQLEYASLDATCLLDLLDGYRYEIESVTGTTLDLKEFIQKSSNQL